MNNLENASSQHILISYSEYERLKNIEEEFQKMQKQVDLSDIDGKDNTDEDLNSADQQGSGSEKSKIHDITDPDFISKIAHLVKQQIGPLSAARPVVTTWSNFDLTPPSTSVIGSVNTTPPLHYDNRQYKNDENDIFGNT